MNRKTVYLVSAIVATILAGYIFTFVSFSDFAKGEVEDSKKMDTLEIQGTFNLDSLKMNRDSVSRKNETSPK